MKALAYATSAALCFAAGGYFMKISEGVTRVLPSFAFVALFVAGAVLQALAMQQTAMGAIYIAVLGIEAVFALGLSVLVLGETFSPARAAALVLILLGVAMLRR